MNMNVKIDDVAKEAGVSIATVSRVLNNNYPVSPKTRKRVEAAVKKLNYSPNVFARGLTGQQSKMIGILAPGFSNLYFDEIVKGIGDALEQQHYLFTVGRTEDEPEEEKRALELFLRYKADGIIVIDGTKENAVNGFFSDVAEQVPFVMINGYSQGMPYDFVMADQDAGVHMALNYLRKRGHEKIALISGERGYSFLEKEEIFCSIMKDWGIQDPERFIVRVPNVNNVETIRNTEDAFRDILLSDQPPTAVFALNEIMATGILNAAAHVGLKVPDDISLIGHDNTLLSQIASVPMTTINLKMRRLGHLAAERILKKIASSREETFEESRKIVINPDLIVRSSCADL